MKNVACIILAAGRGKRMKSSIPKVLHPICGKAMLGYALDLIKDLKLNKIIVVLGYKYQQVKKLIGSGIKIVIQKRLLGTGDAVKKALTLLKNFKGTVLVLYADNPLIKQETVKKLINYHVENNLDATLLTAKVKRPTGFGRILRDKHTSVCGIVEEEDADDFQKDIKEINMGVFCFNKDSLASALKYVRFNNRKKEYYLTDTIDILYKKNCLIDSLRLLDTDEALGINSREDLVKVNSIMQRRINEKFLKEGINIMDSDSTFISYDAKIGFDTTIYPFTVIEKDVKIGRRCFIGPFVHLREGTRIQDDCVVGNFLEVVRSRISSRTLVKHFGYIGDSRIGRSVNVGAGVVTANFDGKKKNITVIKDKAFIGSDTVLIAPVKIGKAAKTGAGALVTKHKDVPDGWVVAGVPAKPLKKR